MIIKHTVSFCPECYKQIPASIDICGDGVFIIKRCSEHGDFRAMIERSAEYYIQCLKSNANNIYNGYFLDVTERCNQKCKFCYYQTSNNEDPSIESIKADAAINSFRAPIILHGGEPTLRNDLPDLIRELNSITPGVELLTNGSGLNDDMLGDIIPMLSHQGGVVNINLSIHPESDSKDMRTIAAIEKLGKKIESVLFVIDDVEQIEGILSFGSKYKHCIEAIRIKAATRLWHEQKPDNKIFVSDMLGHIEKYNPKPIWWRNNKTSFFNFEMDGMFYMLVSWYDIWNVDLVDINCPPYYAARNGQIENIVTACLINEGMSNGWLNGRRYAS